MTNLYFVRHAQSDQRAHVDRDRPLTEKGLRDRTLVTGFLEAKRVSVVVSSPYKRAYDTVAEFAQRNGLAVACIEKLRERRIADEWIEDFAAYTQRQWEDFDYKRVNGESLREVQHRNIEAVYELLATYPGETIAIGTHGTALATILHYFDPTFTYERFAAIVARMPWIVHFQFDGERCVSIEPIDPFAL